MIGADQLANSLQRHGGDVPAALGDWELRMRHHIEYRQVALDGGLDFFVPQDWRRQMARAMATQQLKGRWWRSYRS